MVKILLKDKKIQIEMSDIESTTFWFNTRGWFKWSIIQYLV